MFELSWNLRDEKLNGGIRCSAEHGAMAISLPMVDSITPKATENEGEYRNNGGMVRIYDIYI